MRNFYATDDRVICVDARQNQHRQILSEWKAPDANKLPKEDALALAKERKVDVEWYSIEGKF